MFIIKKSNDKILKEIAKQLKRGAVIVYPTDTAYGLGCDATNSQAVARIFKIKGRGKSKALPMICADQKMVEKYFGFVHGPLSMLARKHWPGPLSIILKAKKGIAKAALKNNTAAVRVPDSVIARTLSKLLGRPLVATSANISGQPTCYSVRAVLRQFGFVIPKSRAMRDLNASNQAQRFLALDKATRHARNDEKDTLIIDSGALPRRRPSTIIRVSKSGKIEVLRQGPIPTLSFRAHTVDKSRARNL
jgi:L-threonylcarbamoyladenylate synthase